MGIYILILYQSPTSLNKSAGTSQRFPKALKSQENDAVKQVHDVGSGGPGPLQQ
jgi:hypothetical protein